jgi:hypothetical protein
LRRTDFYAYSINPCIERGIAFKKSQSVEDGNENLLNDIIAIKRPA